MEKKKQNVLLIIMGALITISLIARLCVIKDYSISGIPMIVSLIFVALYGFWLYKKPHGNMLKYAMLLFAFASIISAVSVIIMDMDYISTSEKIKYDIAFKIVKILCASAICYGAGRLNRIKQNRILFPIIDLLFLVESVSMFFTYSNDYSVLIMFSYFNFTIAFTTLMIAYFVRYKEHREAGLTDK